MNIKLLRAENQKKLEDFLFPYKPFCMFICGNLKSAGIEYSQAQFHGEYYGCFDNVLEQINGVIVHYWNGNIMMYAPNQEILKDLAKFLKQNTKRPIAGILGPESQAEVVIEELGLVGTEYNINSTERLYEIDLNDLQMPELPSSFKLIAAKEAQKDLLISWMKDYEIEALGAKQNAELEVRAKNKVENLIANGAFVLMKDGMLVSLCAFNASSDDMVQVGPVWTPPEHRNRGFAKLLVNFTLNETKKRGGRKAILFTDNPAAIKVYEDIGFKIIGHYRLALLTKPQKIL